MFYRIASQNVEVSCGEGLQNSLIKLEPYRIDALPDGETKHINIIKYKLSTDKIPRHADGFTGFLTHKSIEPGKEDFIFCLRMGTLLFGMQHEKSGEYNVYIHSQPAISCPTAVQYILLLNGFKDNYLGVHAVTLECEGRAIMFSAPSGTGKTTHTELWRREFGSKILNGDFAFIRITDGKSVFCGTPFCGSSPYAEIGEWPVTDIVYLRQAPENSIYRITGIRAIAAGIENCFVPNWDSELAAAALDLVNAFLKSVRIWQLDCNMNPEAAHVAREAILKT